jgi:hypothetical protein
LFSFLYEKMRIILLMNSETQHKGVSSLINFFAGQSLPGSRMGAPHGATTLRAYPCRTVISGRGSGDGMRAGVGQKQKRPAAAVSAARNFEIPPVHRLALFAFPQGEERLSGRHEGMPTESTTAH